MTINYIWKANHHRLNSVACLIVYLKIYLFIIIDLFILFIDLIQLFIYSFF